MQGTISTVSQKVQKVVFRGYCVVAVLTKVYLQEEAISVSYGEEQGIVEAISRS